jgi:choline dehydrogenase
VAARLSEDLAAQVLLIEAGPDYPRREDLPPELRHGQAEGDVIPGSHLWNLEASFGRERHPERLARGKVVGGSGAVNGQVFLRGIPDDFLSWVEAGAAGWSFEEVLPYFRLIESDLDFVDQWHGAGGPVPVRRYRKDEWLPPQEAFFEACRARGFAESADANNPASTGIAPIPFNNVGGVRLSAALTHLAPARDRPNLRVIAGAEAVRIRFQGSKAAGIDVVAGGESIAFDGEDVILAAGVIGTPKLLLLSGIGPAADLSRLGIEPVVDLPAVGQNLRDHQVVDLTWTSDENAWRPPPRAPLLQVVLTYSSGSGLRNDMKVTARSRSMAHRDDTNGPAMLAIVPGVYLPRSRGSLTLASADPAVQPVIKFDFLAEEADLARLREGVRLALELSTHSDLKEWTASRTTPCSGDLESNVSLDTWLRASVRSSQHACGTCRMGGDADPAAVVDPAGQVKGIENLRIVDASVFPDIVRAHINATTLAVAERMAELIRSRR